jgi:hypothetical protein
MAAVMFLTAGCLTESRVTVKDPCSDPNDRAIEITYKGEAANIMAQSSAANLMTVEGRRTKIVESLIPYYGILFLLGIGGIVVIGVLKYFNMSSKILWIAPAACFGGMAVIHFYSDFAAYFKWIVVGGIVLLFISLNGWKLIEYKWERNQSEKANGKD